MLFFWVNTINAQNTFSKIIDIDTTMNDNNTANTIVADEGGLLMGTLDFCNNNTCTDFVKTDLEGSIIWINTPDNYINVKTSLGNLIKTIEGNYATIATIENMQGYAIGGILNLDTIGEDISWLPFCDNAYGIQWHALRQLPDSSFLATYGIGNSNDPETIKRYLVNIDKYGETIDSIKIDYELYGTVGAYDTCQNGYFMAERVWEEFAIGADVYAIIRRTDLQGIPIWETHLNKTMSDAFPSAVTMRNGDVAVAWASDNTPIDGWPYRKYVACLDGNTGEERWRVFFGDTSEQYIENIILASNGDIIGVGNDFDIGNAWLFRISPQGVLLWERKYNHTSSNPYGANFLIDMCSTPDDGIAAAGVITHKNADDEWENDAWLLKVDANGCLESGCDEGFIDVSVGLSNLPPITSNAYSATVGPNPAQHQISVFYDIAPNGAPAEFKIYDLHGRLQLQQNLSPQQHRQNLEIDFLPSSVYVYELIQNNRYIATGKLFKK